MLRTLSAECYLAALLAMATTVAADSGCYSRAIGIIQPGNWIKCPNTALTLNGASACCMAGSLCGEDSLCHTPESLSTGGNNWYPAGCTDPTYTDPVCRLSCTTGYPTFVTYNTSAGLWACCGGGGCNGTVTSETFSAIAPAQWSAVPTTATNSWNVAATVSVPTSSSTATSATTSAASIMASTSSTPTTTATSTPSPAGGLSTGAKAGIGIGIAVPVVALLAGLTYFLLRRRKQKGAIELRNDYSLPPYNEAMQHTAAYKYGGRVQSSELSGSTPESRQELDAPSMPQELPTEHTREQKS